jgi:hypothetical protein
MRRVSAGRLSSIGSEQAMRQGCDHDNGHETQSSIDCEHLQTLFSLAQCIGV